MNFTPSQTQKPVSDSNKIKVSFLIDQSVKDMIDQIGFGKKVTKSSVIEVAVRELYAKLMAEQRQAQAQANTQPHRQSRPSNAKPLTQRRRGR